MGRVPNFDSHSNENDQPPSGEVSELRQQLTAALEQYAARLPEAVMEEIEAGETEFSFAFKSNIQGHTLNRTRRGNLGKVIARPVQRNYSISGRIKGDFHLITPEEGSYITVVFQDTRGISRVGRSDPDQWIILQQFVSVDPMSPEGILYSYAFYKGNS